MDLAMFGLNKGSDCSRQEWLSDITKSQKLNLYREIKSLLEPERYLLEIRNRNLHKTLANFRISCHNLAVEQGRHKNIPLNERICLICQKNGSILYRKRISFCSRM